MLNGYNGFNGFRDLLPRSCGCDSRKEIMAQGGRADLLMIGTVLGVIAIMWKVNRT